MIECVLLGREGGSECASKLPAGMVKVFESRWPELRGVVRACYKEPKCSGSEPKSTPRSTRQVSRRPLAVIGDPFEAVRRE